MSFRFVSWRDGEMGLRCFYTGTEMRYTPPGPDV